METCKWTIANGQLPMDNCENCHCWKIAIAGKLLLLENCQIWEIAKSGKLPNLENCQMDKLLHMDKSPTGKIAKWENRQMENSLMKKWKFEKFPI